ncbi:MAG: Xaa-Pro peptidase family protein [Clostridiales bacterium]|jgi:Xaa-Pro dipeptidase|nr:Xaa-Pro peptidase family protein [Clostridiales bacterium]MDR2713437.1 Xaa-Pro peptidase family protein [Clostridiales bacterium]
MEKARIEKLAAHLKAADLGGIMVCPSEEMLFLAGFTPMMCERFQALFITAEGKYFYVCNLLYEGEMNHNFGGEVKIYPWMDGESMTDTVRTALADYGLLGQTLAVNSSAQAFNTLDIVKDCDVTFVNGKYVLEEARIIKTAEETENLRRAAKINDDVFVQALSFIRPGMKEADILQFMTEKMVAAGGADPWGIIASGPNSSYPHYHGTDRVVGEQDLMILDFGCTFGGMFSDMSRTIFVGGITEEQRKVYGIVRQAYEAGEAAAKTGAFIPDVDKAARDIIDNAGYKEYFINRLGHGIGYMIHEGPDIKKNNYRNLEPGMAFSVEPGIYIAGKFGMRIENIVMATADGNEVLNKSSKEIIII